MFIQRAEKFTFNETTIKVAEGDEVDAYWVTTSGCVFFVDTENGFRINNSARICKTIEEATAWAKATLKV